MPYKGATVTLRARFPDTAGDLSQLANVKVEITDTVGNHIETLTNTTKLETGLYEVDYTFTGAVIYEFTGTLAGRTLIGKGVLSETTV